MDSMPTPSQGWTPFDSALGGCAVAWGAHGILAMQLPEVDAPATQARLRYRRRPSAAGRAVG